MLISLNSLLEWVTDLVVLGVHVMVDNMVIRFDLHIMMD